MTDMFISNHPHVLKGGIIEVLNIHDIGIDSHSKIATKTRLSYFVLLYSQSQIVVI